MAGIEELLECPLCLDRFKIPKVLPCQHTYCLRPCLQNLVQDNRVRCPECRACHNIPLTGVERLPTNLTIVRLLDRSDQQKPHRQCKECKMGDDNFDKCNHCDESLCRSCIARHTREMQQHLRHSLLQVTRLVSKLAESDYDLQDRAKKLEENGVNVIREISQSIERVISDLQSRKKRLIEEVDAFVAMETGSLQREQEELKVKMAALATHCQIAREKCERPLTLSNPEMKQFHSEILRLAQQGREHLRSNGITSDKVRQTITFTNGDENVVLAAISTFGSISTHPQPGFRGESTRGSLASDRQPVEHSRVTEVLRRYRKKGQVKKYFGTRGNDLGQFRAPHGISSTATDDIVVADNGNDRIQIFNVNGQAKRVFGSKGESEAQFYVMADVCVTSQGWIVASDEGSHRIQIFDEHGKFVRKFGSKGSGDGKLHDAFGVATDGKGLIYVCDGANRRVQVFSQDGKFVRKFGSEENGLDRPIYLSVTSNGRVVVSDCDKHRVHVFDSYGRHLFQFGTEGTSKSQFKHPRGIATDDHGNIIVCDTDNNRVQVFTSDGQFVSCFGSEGSMPGQMKRPEGVCLLSDGGIAVCDLGNHRVQIFEHQPHIFV